MSKLKEIGLSRQSLGFILGSLLALGLLIFLGILPARTEINRLEAEAEQLQARIQEQEILHPLYSDLENALQEQEILEEIIIEEEGKPNAVDVDNAADLMLDIAGKSGLEDSSFSPSPESLADNSDRLLVKGAITGDYHRFREFLVRLTSWNYFDYLELLEVHSQEDGDLYELQVWLNLE